MAVVAKMINPTPFNVKIPYQLGVSIRIPADGEIDLTMEQLDDFRPGKPGSEETRKTLEFEGVFLQDSDLSYDVQALQALQSFVRERKARVKNFVERNKAARLKQGAACTDAEMDELKSSAGYSVMEANVSKVEARIRILEKTVNADMNKGSVKQTLDPTRTCFVINPPRQFPSRTALAMFLAENPEIKAKHDEFTNPTAQSTTKTEVEYV
jgi:hypothetical protein